MNPNDKLKPDGLGPGERENLRRNLVKGALKNFKYNPAKVVETPEDRIILKARETDLEVKRFIKPILQAGGGHDKPAIRGLAASMYLEKFDKYTREELQFVVSTLYTEMFMEFLEGNPIGGDTPDLLAGR